MKFVATSVFLLSLVVPAQRLGIRLNPTSVPSGSILTQADISLVGYFTMPGFFLSHPTNPDGVPYFSNPTGGGGTVACGNVSGVVHCFAVQGSQGFQGSNFGSYSFMEFIDPGTYGATPATATAAPFYRNWGFSNDGFYDFSHGKYGMTYSNTGVLSELSGSQYINTPTGVGYHEQGGVRYIYQTYGVPYGNPPGDGGPWNMVICSLDNPGTADAHQTGLATTCNGPYRICAGTGVYGGAQDCGPWRGAFFAELPDGSFGTSNGFTSSQNPPNWGPSLWGGGAWPTTATSSAYGSDRGSHDYRTTDIQPPVDYLSHYQLTDGEVNIDGTLNGVPQWSGRRPPFATATLAPNPPGFANYAYEGGTGSTYGVPFNSFQNWVDPAKYGGVGSWVNGDITNRANWVTGTKEGVLFPGHFAVGPIWYKTRTGQIFSPYGTGSNILFMRSAGEAWTATCFNEYHAGTGDCGGTANADIRYDVTPANYSSVPANVVTVKYQKDGAGSSLSCTASGKAITVHLATNGSNVPTSTANQVITAINTTGACSTLVTASISTENGANTGAGVIPGVIDKDYSNTHTASPAGTLVVAYGPQNSPIDNIDLQINVTGPNAIYYAGMSVYDPSTLQATPDYNVTPDSFIWFNVLDPNFPCPAATPGSPSPQCNIAGSYYEPTTRNLYVFSSGADATTGFEPKPMGAVFHIAGTTAPEPTLWTWLWAQAPQWLKRPVTKPVSLLERPR